MTIEYSHVQRSKRFEHDIVERTEMMITFLTSTFTFTNKSFSSFRNTKR